MACGSGSNSNGNVASYGVNMYILDLPLHDPRVGVHGLSKEDCFQVIDTTLRHAELKCMCDQCIGAQTVLVSESTESDGF